MRLVSSKRRQAAGLLVRCVSVSTKEKKGRMPLLLSQHSIENKRHTSLFVKTYASYSSKAKCGFVSSKAASLLSCIFVI